MVLSGPLAARDDFTVCSGEGRADHHATVPAQATAIVSLATGRGYSSARSTPFRGLWQASLGRNFPCHLQYGQSNTLGNRLVMRILQVQGEQINRGAEGP